MKNRFFSLFLLFNLFFWISDSYAAEIAPEGARQRKFQRGLINIFFSPVELSHEWAKVKTKEGWLLVPTWAFPGGVKGCLLMLRRFGAGMYDLLTFPVPLPSDYRPLVQPEFVLEHLGQA